MKEGERGKQRTSGGVAEWSVVGGMLFIPPRNGASRRAAMVGVALGAQTGLFPAGLLELPTNRNAEHATERTDRNDRPKLAFTNSKASHTNIITNIKMAYTNIMSGNA